LSDGRLTLEPTEWNISEAELTEAVEWFSACYTYCSWAERAVVGGGFVHDYTALKKQYQKCYTAADAALFNLSGCDWARVQRSPLETAANHPNQSLLDL
jgi:hypothetical protein